MEWRGVARLNGHYGPECFQSLRVLGCERGMGADGPMRPFYLHLRLNHNHKSQGIECQVHVAHVDGAWEASCVGVRVEEGSSWDTEMGLGCLFWLCDSYLESRVDRLVTHARGTGILEEEDTRWT